MKREKRGRGRPRRDKTTTLLRVYPETKTTMERLMKELGLKELEEFMELACATISSLLLETQRLQISDNQKIDDNEFLIIKKSISDNQKIPPNEFLIISFSKNYEEITGKPLIPKEFSGFSQGLATLTSGVSHINSSPTTVYLLGNKIKGNNIYKSIGTNPYGLVPIRDGFSVSNAKEEQPTTNNEKKFSSKSEDLYNYEGRGVPGKCEVFADSTDYQPVGERIFHKVLQEGYAQDEAQARRIADKAVRVVDYFEGATGNVWEEADDVRLIELLVYLPPGRIKQGINAIIREAKKQEEGIRPFRYYVTPILQVLRKAMQEGEEKKRVKYFGWVNLSRSRKASPRWVVKRWNEVARSCSRMVRAEYSGEIAEKIKAVGMDQRLWENLLRSLPGILEEKSFEQMTLARLLTSKTKAGSSFLAWFLDEMLKAQEREGREEQREEKLQKVVDEAFFNRLRKSSIEAGVYDQLKEALKALGVRIKRVEGNKVCIVFSPHLESFIELFLAGNWDMLAKKLEEEVSHACDKRKESQRA